MRRTAIAVGAIVLVAPQSLATVSSSAEAQSSRRTTIVVQVNRARGSAPTELLGANGHYDSNGRGLWDPASGAPVAAVVTKARRAGLQVMRYPGGTVANMYDWKRAIGPERGCQVVGPQGRGDQGRAVSRGLAFGPDEVMQFADVVGAETNIMVPFVNETPGDAADWVEYMNAPAGVTGNPNGGVDWADVRADNGHIEPYGVHWWEIGNEQEHRLSRYWMSPNDRRAIHQYAFGGSRLIRSEPLGKGCAHPRAGVPSDGTAAQTFNVLYPPVAARSVRVVIAGRAWSRVRSLSSAGPNARVFTVGAENGQVQFGDGLHGAIPSRGSRARASYRSVHQGFFAFARQMKKADPSIKVCSTWGDPAFNRLVRHHRRYDCLAAHAIILFAEGKGARARWSGPLEGHHQLMVKSGSFLRRTRELRATMPRATPLHLTEFVTMHGDGRAFPAWATSVSHAVYMSSVWAHLLNLGIPWGNGDDLLGKGQAAVLGGGRDHTFTADAVTRQALSPMFSRGGARLATRIVGNPIEHPRVTAPDSYPALIVAATRSSGEMNLLVVNRLPSRGVSTRIRLDGRRALGTANVRTVSGPSFRSWNRPAAPPSVVLRVRDRKIGATGFRYRFPPASTTVFRIPLVISNALRCGGGARLVPGPEAG